MLINVSIKKIYIELIPEIARQFSWVSEKNFETVKTYQYIEV